MLRPFEPVCAPATWLLVSLMAIMHASVGGYCGASVSPFVSIVLFMSHLPLGVHVHVHVCMHVCVFTVHVCIYIYSIYVHVCIRVLCVKKGFVAFVLQGPISPTTLTVLLPPSRLPLLSTPPPPPPPPPVAFHRHSNPFPWRRLPLLVPPLPST